MFGLYDWQMDHRLLINYPQMKPGSNLYNRHALPGPGQCTQSYVGGSGESHLKRNVEKHEGTNYDPGSHTGIHYDWLNNRLSTIQTNFESFVGMGELDNDVMFARLTGASWDTFIGLDDDVD